MLKKIGICAVLTASLCGGFAAITHAADGEAVYRKICSYCHDDGQIQAPRLGDKAAWKERAQKPRDMLYRSVLDGTGHMPPRSGAQDFSDADVKAAVDFILSRVQ